MAEHLRFVDATNGSPYYDSAAFAQVEEVKVDGVAYNYLNELEVIQYGALQVKVKDGAMVSKGRTYIQDEPSDGASPKILTLEAAQAGYLRKDMIVVEFDLQNCLGAAKIVKGVEDLTDLELPNLTDEPNLWQVCLAIVDVDDTTITNIEDKRVIGNGRTNPAFTENISAPNITTGKVTSNSVVSIDGKLSFNEDETAYLQYTDNTLNLKIPNKEEIEITSRLVAEVVLDTGASSIVIDNLDIYVDGGTYEFTVAGDATAGGSFYLYINDDTTISNYSCQTSRYNGTSFSTSRASIPKIGVTDTQHFVTRGTIDINPLKGYVVVDGTTAEESSTVEITDCKMCSHNTFSNVTKLNFSFPAGDLIAGTTLKIYKR